MAEVTLDTGTVVPVLAVYQAGEEGYVVETSSSPTASAAPWI